MKDEKTSFRSHEFIWPPLDGPKIFVKFTSFDVKIVFAFKDALKIISRLLPLQYDPSFNHELMIVYRINVYRDGCIEKKKSKRKTILKETPLIKGI